MTDFVFCLELPVPVELSYVTCYICYTKCIHMLYMCCTYVIHSERHSGERRSGTCNFTLASTGPHTTNTSEQFSDLPHWLVCYTHCNFLTWIWGRDERRRERRVRGNKGGTQDHAADHGVHTFARNLLV